MAGTGIKGYTGETGKYTIKDGIITSTKTPTESSSRDYITTPSGKSVPTYGHAVVQRGADGKLYATNKDGETTAMNGGRYTYKSGAGAPSSSGGGSSSKYSPTYSDDDDDDYSYGGGRYGGRSYNVIDPETQALKDKLTELEANKPAAYKNQYEGQIQNVLDTIMNRKAFDIKTDNNYQQLYDLYQQQYQAQASRGMRDAMGQLAGMTGGYGNTYAQTVGQQQYDQTMQGMNDNNINLMNLAYGIYADDRANDFNKMSTLRGLEGDDYSKYRDTMSDYYTDLNHYTNRYNTAWGNDYQLNRDAINDARYEDELAYAREQDRLNRELAEEERDYERAWNEDDRSYSRNNSAFQNALSLARAGYDPSSYLNDNGYTGSSGDLLRGIAAQIQAANAPSASSGGSSSGRSSSGRYNNGGSDNKETIAEFLARKKGLNRINANATSSANSVRK